MKGIVKRINSFLVSQSMKINLKFNDGYYMKLKKHINGNEKSLEIHTPEYDGIMEINEALDWIKWTLFDYQSDGII